MLKINQTDLRLISAIQDNGSVNYSDLASALKITQKTVARRLERLLESKVLTIRAQPNPYKLGLSASAVIAIKADPAKIEPVCERLCEHFFVNLVQTVFGRFDILAIVYFPDWEAMHRFMDRELFSIDGITQAEFYFVGEVFRRYERFFKKEPFSADHAQFDENDWILIRSLARDGRANPAELAEKLGVHVTTVYRRIGALVKGNYIKISGVPNPCLLDHSANAYITLDVESKKVPDVCAALMTAPEVHFFMTLTNRTGVITCIHTENTETLYEFVKKRISPQQGLLNMETHMRAAIKKTYYGFLVGRNNH